MYLSRVELDITKKQTQIALISRNKFHGAVEAAFCCTTENRSRNLWRLDKLAGKIYLLILSKEKPDLYGIVRQFGTPGSLCETKEYDALLNRVTEQSVWRFRVVANPTKCIRDEDGRRKRIAHTTLKYQMKWFVEQGEKHGFQIMEDKLQIMESTWLMFNKQNERMVRAFAVTYEGILKVNDVEKFKEILTEGLGREKAYGMGLMTTMRASV